MPGFGAVERILSRPTAKPYRTNKLSCDEEIFLDEDGHIVFGPDDIENPRNWSFRRKLYITIVSTLLVLNATFASSAPTGCLDSLAEEFNISIEAAGLTVTLFLGGYSFGPLFFAPLSEFFGRRWIFYGTFFMFVIFNFLTAWAPTFGGLLVGRFLTGTFASAPMSNGPGVLADLWGPIGRSNAMGMYTMMTFIGPALGPVIAGFLELKENWRWIYYVMLMMSGGTALWMLQIPETLPSAVLTNKARRIRKLKIPGYENVQSPVEASNRSLMGIFKIALTRPWVMLTDTVALLVAIYLSIVYSLLYMLFTIYPIVFIQKRGWNAGVGQLPLLGVIIGAIVGMLIVFAFSIRDKRKLARGGKIEPEDRLPVGMVGAIGFAVCMFWFAWTAQYNSIFWLVPTIAGVFLSTSIVLIFVSFMNYAIETYLMYAASAMAINTVCRSACGGATPLYTQYMFNALGVGGGGSLIGGLAVILAVIPFVFNKYGPEIRMRSKFNPRPVKKGHLEKKDGDAESFTSSSSSFDYDIDTDSLVQVDTYGVYPVPSHNGSRAVTRVNTRDLSRMPTQHMSRLNTRDLRPFNTRDLRAINTRDLRMINTRDLQQIPTQNLSRYNTHDGHDSLSQNNSAQNPNMQHVRTIRTIDTHGSTVRMSDIESEKEDEANTDVEQGNNRVRFGGS